MHNLPKDVVQLIFSFFNDENHFKNIALVSKQFNRLVKDPYQAFKTAKLKKANIFYLELSHNLEQSKFPETFQIFCPDEFTCSKENTLEIFTHTFLIESSTQKIIDEACLKLKTADCLVIMAYLDKELSIALYRLLFALQKFAREKEIHLPPIIIITYSSNVKELECSIKTFLGLWKKMEVNLHSHLINREINFVKVLGGSFVGKSKIANKALDGNLAPTKDFISELEACIYRLLVTPKKICEPKEELVVETNHENQINKSGRNCTIA